MIPAGAISADSHVVEPPNCYVDFIDPKYRDRAPRIVTQPDGSDAFHIDGMKKDVGLGLMDGAGFARDMEAAYRDMWKQWVEREPESGAKTA